MWMRTYGRTLTSGQGQCLRLGHHRKHQKATCFKHIEATLANEVRVRWRLIEDPQTPSSQVPSFSHMQRYMLLAAVSLQTSLWPMPNFMKSVEMESKYVLYVTWYQYMSVYIYIYYNDTYTIIIISENAQTTCILCRNQTWSLNAEF